MNHSAEYRRILHKMGYYGYQDGLIHRHLGQEGGWDEHNLRCRSYILRAIKALHPGKVTVLGSGWLLDIPLAEMAEMVGKIELIDIIHPPRVKEQVSVYGNVNLKEEDVTGGVISEVWNLTHKSFFRKARNLSQLSVPLYKTEDDPGLVISLNILTQLDNLPAEYLREKTPVPSAELAEFRKNIQKNHVEFLIKHDSVLISDYEEIFKGTDGVTKVVPTLLTGITYGKQNEKWTWDFDLRGSDYYQKRSVLKVFATTFEK